MAGKLPKLSKFPLGEHTIQSGVTLTMTLLEVWTGQSSIHTPVKPHIHTEGPSTIQKQELWRLTDIITPCAPTISKNSLN